MQIIACVCVAENHALTDIFFFIPHLLSMLIHSILHRYTPNGPPFGMEYSDFCECQAIVMPMRYTFILIV